MRLLVPSHLIERATHGSAADVERLLEALWPGAFRLARAIVPQTQAAEDAAQEACVRIYHGLASLRRTEAFSAWFYRIVVREALKQKKALSATNPLDADTAYTDDPVIGIDLWRALAALSDRQRAVVVLHYFEGLSSREIGAILTIPSATVRFRLSSARRALAHLLQPSSETKGEELYAL